MSTDSGLLESKTNEELSEYMEELGVKFEYGCIKENNPISCHSLAQWYNSFKHSYNKYAEILKENCYKRNFGESCFTFASLKLIGYTNINRDALEAFHVLDYGCKTAKHGKCCQGAGRLIAEGISTHTPSLLNAIPYFQLGCELNLPESCFHLGGALLSTCDLNNNNNNTENATSHNEIKSRILKAWISGCNLGHELSCRNVAKMYSKADGVEFNQSKIDEYKNKADKLIKQKLQKEYDLSNAEIS